MRRGPRRPSGTAAVAGRAAEGEGEIVRRTEVFRRRFRSLGRATLGAGHLQRRRVAQPAKRRRETSQHGEEAERAARTTLWSYAAMDLLRASSPSMGVSATTTCCAPPAPMGACCAAASLARAVFTPR